MAKRVPGWFQKDLTSDDLINLFMLYHSLLLFSCYYLYCNEKASFVKTNEGNALKIVDKELDLRRIADDEWNEPSQPFTA